MVALHPSLYKLRTRLSTSMSALQISLVEMPSFSFNINVYGGDITFLPGVEKWINWFIETRVLRPFVLPERLTVPVRFLYDPTLEVSAVPYCLLLQLE